MPNEEEKTIVKVEDFSAELLILEDMGLDPEKLGRINSLDAATKLIKYQQSKVPKPDEKGGKNMLTLKKNMGQKLPPAEPLTDEIKLNLKQALNPLSVKRANNSRWNKKSRLMMHWNEDKQQMEVF